MKNTEDFFYKCLEDHKAILHKISKSYCKNDEDRHDLFQEIVIQIWRSIGKYNSQYKMSTWIYRIALNTAISFYRKHKKHDNNSELQSDAILSIDESTWTERDENLDQLHQYIDSMNAINKALILLYLDDYDYQSISDILGISVSNVGTKIARIKTALKEHFAQEANTSRG